MRDAIAVILLIVAFGLSAAAGVAANRAGIDADPGERAAWCLGEGE